MKKLVTGVLILAITAGLNVPVQAATDISELETNDAVSHYDSDGSGGTSVDDPSVKTELWLQVDASGQIDVTVPLVLIFKTNIDGGSATTGTSYMIQNNSTAPLVVTKIERQDVGSSQMTLKNFAAPSALGEDEYGVQLEAGSKGPWDLMTASHSATRENGGLFGIPKQVANSETAGETVIKATMNTGKLSFITARDGQDMDTTKGVKLMNITYTVAMDTSAASTVDGSEISAADVEFNQ